MDMHLKELFGSFQQQFGGVGDRHRRRSSTAPPLSPQCNLSRIDGVSTMFIKAIFRACSALYLSNPWQKCRPQHLFGVHVHGSKPFFTCAQFVGSSAGDPALFIYRSDHDAVSCLPSSGFQSMPNLSNIPSSGILRVTFTTEAQLPQHHRKMIKVINAEVSGLMAYPFIDIIYPKSSSQNPSPSVDELRWLYACLKAITQVHPSMQQQDAKALRAVATFTELLQVVDIQWPAAEDAKFWEVTSVKISHPPQRHKDATTAATTTTQQASKHAMDQTDFSLGRSAPLSVPRRCAMCNAEVLRTAAPRCSKCKAVIYCGHECQKQHWVEQHKGSCELYKALMEREEELEMKIFHFLCLMEQPCRWLENLGLHGAGMWRRMCECFKDHPFGLLPEYLLDNEVGNPWGLENRMCPADTPLLGTGESTSMVLLSGWAEYYNLRNLPLGSPVSVILSYPLSVYHIVTSLNVATKAYLAKGREVVVHYLGPENELDWIPAFSELAHLLGSSGTLHITMIGPEVPDSRSFTTITLGHNLKMTFVKGMYQNEIGGLQSPHVVVSLNSGLETYGSWSEALRIIQDLNVPAFFTDYSEPCCANAKQVLRAAGLHISHPVTPNPFRSPVKIEIASCNLPWFSNGFIFGVNT